jgi:hypothetical protein
LAAAGRARRGSYAVFDLFLGKGLRSRRELKWTFAPTGTPVEPARLELMLPVTRAAGPA